MDKTDREKMVGEKTNDVMGLGNALMDFLVEVEDHQLLDFGLKKGEFHLADEKKAHFMERARARTGNESPIPVNTL